MPHKKGGLSGPYNGIYMVTTPMPFPLKSSNGFIGETDQGWVIIDGGVNTESNRHLWEAALEQLGISWQEVTAIYLTHYHHDHIGLAGWMQQNADAPVYINEQDARMVEQLLLLSASNYVDRFNEECRNHHWSRELLHLLANDVAGIAYLLDPLPQLSLLPPQHTFKLAGYDMTIMPTPGHTDGHHNFLAGNEILFAGDNLLANYHLHATDWPHNQVANPLQHFLMAMSKLEHLPIKQVLPGHGPVFANFQERLQSLYQHHSTRMTRVLEQLDQPQTAWQLAKRVFPDADYIHIKRLILAETLAYLQFLESSHLIQSRQEGVVTRYYPLQVSVSDLTMEQLLFKNS